MTSANTRFVQVFTYVHKFHSILTLLSKVKKKKSPAADFLNSK